MIVSPRGAPPPGSASTEQARLSAEKLREERHKEELCSMLRELTRYISVQDAMRSVSFYSGSMHRQPCMPCLCAPSCSLRSSR